MIRRDQHIRTCTTALSALLLVAGCGNGGSPHDGLPENTGDGGNTNDATNGSQDGGGGQVYDVDLTAYPIRNDDSFPFPHDIRFYDVTGTIADVDTAIHTMKSEELSGLVKTTLMPAGDWVTIHVIGSDRDGVPPMEDWTYDLVVLNSPPNNGDPLLRIPTFRMSELANETGDYVNRADRAALLGAVYYTPGGPGNPRGEGINCAEIYLDDSTTPLDEDSDQRYSAGVLPTTPDELQETNPTGGGRFYFGNIPTGTHTLRAVDKTTGEDLAEVTFDIPLARRDAVGPAKDILYQLGIDVPGNAKPGC